MSTRREVREDIAEEIRQVLRDRGETDNTTLSRAIGQSTDLTRSVCAELALSGALVCRQAHARGRMHWRLEGQLPDCEARDLQRLCRARGVGCDVVRSGAEARARARHPSGDGWVWIDSAEDLDWLLVDLDLVGGVAA